MLAYLYDEAGSERVTEVLNSRAYIGAANWAEVLSKVADKGHSTDNLVQVLRSQGFMGNALVVLPTTEEDAEFIAKLRPETKQHGLSLGDRACLVPKGRSKRAEGRKGMSCHIRVSASANG